MSLNPLEQSILKTLHYFDIVDYPLTKEELFAFLWQPPAMGYADFLEHLNSSKGIETKSGFYFLPGREDIVAKRQRRLVISEEKLRIARRAVKKLRSVPYLRAIFVCNSVGSEVASGDSDIDFFIVTEPKRIWMVRFFANFILRILGLRTYGKKIKDKICLSFFLDTNNFDMSGLRVVEDDIHFAYWTLQMVPIYDPEDCYSKFLNANRWIKKFIPNASDGFKTTSRLEIKNGKLGLLWKRAWEKMWSGAYGDIIESQAKGFQWAKIGLSIKQKSKDGDKGVVLSDGVLKFHEKDARVYYRDTWKQKISSAG